MEGTEPEGNEWEESPQQQPPQQQPPQQQPPAQQGQPQYDTSRRREPPARREDFLERLTSNDGLAKIMTVGFILLLVGMLLIHAAPFATNWGSDAVGEDAMDQEDMASDEATENTITYIGRMISDFGIFFVGLFLVLGGIHRDDLDTKYRITMIVLAVIFIMVVWFGFLTVIPTT